MTLIPVALVLFGFGIVNTFFGYRFFNLLVALWGFAFGAGIGLTLFANAQPMVIVVIAAVCGFIMALLSYFILRIGVFILGAIFGVSIAYTLLMVLNLPVEAEGVSLIIMLVAAVIGGLLALAVQKTLIIIATAFTGASMLVYAVLLLIPDGAALRQTARGTQMAIQINPDYTLYALIAIGIVGVIGGVYQYRTTGGKMRV
jgi:hypothetical protein